MSLDVSKLSLAPWRQGGFGSRDTVYPAGGDEEILEAANVEDAAFCALARNALDVQLRRRWAAKLYADGTWGVQDEYGGLPKGLLGWTHAPFADPVTPLVEADRWLGAREGTEAGACGTS